MAAREFHGVIRNKHDSDITWVNDECDGGEWDNGPSETAKLIKKDQEGYWSSESSGILTGTSGWSLWNTGVDDHTEFIIVNWRVPFYGTPTLTWGVYRYNPTDTGGSKFQDKTPAALGIQLVLKSQDGSENILAEAATLAPYVFTIPFSWFIHLFTEVKFETHPRLVFVVRRVKKSEKLQAENPPQLLIDSVSELDWKVPSLGCGTAGALMFKLQSNDLWTLVEGEGLVQIRNGGGQRLEIASVQRISPDPAQMFQPGKIQVRDLGQPSGAYEISVKASPNAYYNAAPYPLQLQITSNGGTATANLGALPPIDDNLATQIRNRAGHLHSQCNAMINDWYRLGVKLQLKWILPDPPPDAHPVERLWVIQAVGLAPGSVVRIERERNDSAFGAMLAGREGEARFSLIVPASDGDLGAVLERHGGPEASDMVGVSTTQVELAQVAELPFSAPFSEIVGVTARSRVLAVGVGNQMLEARGLNPTPGEGAWTLPVEGLRGCTALRDFLLAWGQEGLLLVSLGGELLQTVHPEPVTAVAVAQELVWALGSDDTLTLYDSRSFDGVQRMRVPAPTALAGAGAAVALISEGRLKAGWLDQERCRIEIAEIDSGEIELTREHQLRSVGGAVLAGTGNGGDLLGFQKPTRPTLLARYQKTPWFLAGAPAGRFWVYQPDGRRQVVAAIAGRSAVTL